MFRRKTKRFLYFWFIAYNLFMVSLASAQSLTSSELIINAKEYDAKKITYEGEVIADIMYRGDFVWLNVNDSKNAIGIYCNKELVQGLGFLAGGYNKRGDWLKIEGIFNRACNIHGGDLDIHAEAIEILKKGKVLGEKVNLEKKKIVYQLVGVLLCLLILKLLVMKLRRR